MSKCPSKIFGSCAPNATYSPNGDIDDCLQYCTPSPCPSNLNNILSDCINCPSGKWALDKKKCIDCHIVCVNL